MELRLRYLNKRPVKLPDFKPNYNLCPSQDALVLRIENGEPRFDLLRWGLVPFWAKDLKIGYKMINARADTISEKPSFRNAYQKRRCIVPLSGFIEWKREGESKRPFCIYLKDEPIMSLAGIWETWKAGTKDEVNSFSIVTTEANKFMAKIHDRMPVILDVKDEEAWLDPGTKPEMVSKLLKPCPPSRLEAHEVATLINSPKNNSEDVLRPLTGEIL